MIRVLFVSNGHGEAAIADRIAVELKRLRPQAQLDHLALVGESRSDTLREVGPRRPMPSGGLIAMGNVRNLLRDLRAGLLALVGAQRRFLRDACGRYDAAVAVGDAYALAMTLRTRLPSVFVGTAKSVSVAPYGRFEERLLRRAAARFVRDQPTAHRLRERGVRVEGVANVIVDLFAGDSHPLAEEAVRDFEPALALFPGSREEAYADAEFLLAIAREIAVEIPKAGAVLSIAPGLNPQQFAAAAQAQGWEVHANRGAIPFSLARAGRTVVRAWTGPLGPLLTRVTLVLGQAGTANEGAAAAGVPVAAFQSERDGRSGWYRRRQQGLLGEALAVFPRDVETAVPAVLALLRDARRLAAMGAAGRARMGAPGGATRVAETIVAVAEDGCAA